jgi:LPS sulfotransferase NodH
VDRPFDSFVIFAGKRTGSNFLEASLNMVPGVTCHGEAFNPYFIGYPNAKRLLGVDLAAREADPMGLLGRIGHAEGLNGFRYFHDHDPRILDTVLDDPRCAKVVLARNPMDSFISRRLANATGQWKITDVMHRAEARARFSAAAFETFLADIQEFHLRLMNGLQLRGQTGFHIAYEDLGDVAVLNGLLRYLGVAGRLDAPSDQIVRQNPREMKDKVDNLAEMEAAVMRLDLFSLSRIPNLEPRRGAAVPSFIAAAGAPLLYLPVRCGPEKRVLAWLAQVTDGAAGAGLSRSFNRNSLRRWMQERPGHRKFTVVAHPAARAFRAFAGLILTGAYAADHAVLREVFGVPLPDPADAAEIEARALRAAFLGYLDFARMNIDGQTSLRNDPVWTTQSSVLEGFAQLVMPDMILREDRLAEGLAEVADAAGLTASPPHPATDATLARLAEIYDADVEQAVRSAYRRDYLNFGFGPYAA